MYGLYVTVCEKAAGEINAALARNAAAKNTTLCSFRTMEDSFQNSAERKWIATKEDAATNAPHASSSRGSIVAIQRYSCVAPSLISYVISVNGRFLRTAGVHDGLSRGS